MKWIFYEVSSYLFRYLRAMQGLSFFHAVWYSRWVIHLRLPACVCHGVQSKMQGLILVRQYYIYLVLRKNLMNSKTHKDCSYSKSKVVQDAVLLYILFQEFWRYLGKQCIWRSEFKFQITQRQMLGTNRLQPVHTISYSATISSISATLFEEWRWWICELFRLGCVGIPVHCLRFGGGGGGVESIHNQTSSSRECRQRKIKPSLILTLSVQGLASAIIKFYILNNNGRYFTT